MKSKTGQVTRANTKADRNPVLSQVPVAILSFLRSCRGPAILTLGVCILTGPKSANASLSYQ